MQQGSVIGGFRIERRIGGGGMGVVYLAQHPRLIRHDALKVLSAEHSADQEFRARFLREADLIARLDHPNIVTVYDRGIDNGQLWIAMQFVDGGDASDLVGRIPPQRAVEIIRQAAAGLDAAHAAGIVHRDVKPANLLLEPVSSGGERVMVADFGIGRAMDGSGSLTESGAVIATLAYAAPEQLLGGPVDGRADVYALGGTLFHLLTGSKPFDRPSAVEVIGAHLGAPPPRPSAVKAGVPTALDSVIAVAMAKDPQQRYPNCGALAAAATAALDADTSGQTQRPVRRRRRLVLGAAGVLLATAALVIAVVAELGWPGPSARSANTTSAAPTVAVTGTAPPLSQDPWGPRGYMVRMFPQLLPATPQDVGYQGLHCYVVDDFGRSIAVNTWFYTVTRIDCAGNEQPVTGLDVYCLPDGEQMTDSHLPDGVQITGQQDWTRSSSSGHLTWGDLVGADGHQTSGALQISFTDPQHQSCQIVVTTKDHGRALVDTWWPTAPI
jgi:serine/threonine-protein kinase